MLFVVSTNPVEPDPGEYADAYDSQVDAAQICIARAKADRSGATHYVHEVSTRPAFKASTEQVVSTEVMP